jgi:hypothetical protein
LGAHGKDGDPVSSDGDYWDNCCDLPTPAITWLIDPGGDIKMALIIWFLALVAAGDISAYLVGLVVEYEWGGYASLVVFLAMYFITLWVPWRIAVWMTTPKLVPDSGSRIGPQA